MKHGCLVLAMTPALALGCSGPKLLFAPLDRPVVDGDGFTVEYVETPYQTNRPRLRVTLAPADAGGERPARVSVEEEGGRRLKEFRNLFDRSEFAVEVPIADEADGDHDERLVLVVDRPGAPRERSSLMLHVRRIEGATAPLEEEDPSAFLMATYPLWGFWRDLADAPFTMLNRAGLTTARLGDSEINAANALVIAGAMAGAAYVAHEGTQNGDSWFEDEFYFAGGSFVGGIGGAFVAGIVAGAYEWIVVPIQVGLFRTGLDFDFVKREPHAARVGDDGIDLDAYRERLRSFSFFPNWRFVARGKSLQPSLRVRSVWIVDRIGIGSDA